jgi:hypothetical protein
VPGKGVAAVTYRTIVRREGNWWIVAVEGVGVTQTRRLEDVEDMARDLVASMEDVDPGAIDLDVEVRVNDEVDQLRAEIQRLAQEADQLARRAREGKAALMRRLHEAKLSVRDVGKLTGVSHQRVSQIIHEPGTNAVKEAVPATAVHQTREEAIAAAKARHASKSRRKAKVDA